MREGGDDHPRNAAGDQRGSPPLKMRNAMIRRRKNLIANKVQRLPALHETSAEVVQPVTTTRSPFAAR